MTNSVLSTRPARKGSPSPSKVSYTTTKRSPLRKARWKSMSPEKISAICTATLSGIRASSVAANKEVWILPLAMRVLAVSGSVSMVDFLAAPAPRTDRRLKVPSSSGLQRAVKETRRPRSSTSACTLRPARPSRFFCELESARKKADAAGSLTPRRRNKLSAVSVLRVTSLRYKSMACAASKSRWGSIDRGSTTSTTVRTGNSDASGAKETKA